MTVRSDHLSGGDDSMYAQLSNKLCNYCTYLTLSYIILSSPIGDIFVVFVQKSGSFLKLRPAVPSPGKDSVTVPVNTRIEFALTPPSEEGNETNTAIKSWERAYQSVAEFLDIRKRKSLPMPAVRPVHTVT